MGHVGAIDRGCILLGRFHTRPFPRVVLELVDLDHERIGGDGRVDPPAGAEGRDAREVAALDHHRRPLGEVFEEGVGVAAGEEGLGQLREGVDELGRSAVSHRGYERTGRPRADASSNLLGAVNRSREAGALFG